MEICVCFGMNKHNCGRYLQLSSYLNKVFPKHQRLNPNARTYKNCSLKGCMFLNLEPKPKPKLNRYAV